MPDKVCRARIVFRIRAGSLNFGRSRYTKCRLEVPRDDGERGWEGGGPKVGELYSSGARLFRRRQTESFGRNRMIRVRIVLRRFT